MVQIHKQLVSHVLTPLSPARRRLHQQIAQKLEENF